MESFLRHRTSIVCILTILLIFFMCASSFSQTLDLKASMGPEFLVTAHTKDNPISISSILTRKTESTANTFSLVGSPVYGVEMSPAESYLEKLADMQNPTRIRQGAILLILGTGLAAGGAYAVSEDEKIGFALIPGGITMDALGIYLMHGKSRAQKSFERVMQTKDEAEKHKIALETLRFYARNYRAFRFGAATVLAGTGILLTTVPAKADPVGIHTQEEQETMKAMTLGLCFATSIFFLIWKTPPEKLYSQYKKETRNSTGITPSLRMDGRGRVFLSLSYSL